MHCHLFCSLTFTFIISCENDWSLNRVCISCLILTLRSATSHNMMFFSWLHTVIQRLWSFCSQKTARSCCMWYCSCCLKLRQQWSLHLWLSWSRTWSAVTCSETFNIWCTVTAQIRSSICMQSHLWSLWTLMLLFHCSSWLFSVSFSVLTVWIALSWMKLIFFSLQLIITKISDCSGFSDTSVVCEFAWLSHCLHQLS